MKRDKEATKQNLIAAVGTLVLREGFSAIGINAVSKEAGVDKVLIYRYFGDLDGLLKAYISGKDYFSNMSAIVSTMEEIRTVDDAVRIAKSIFVGQLKDILSNQELREIVLWELQTANSATAAVAAEREAQGVLILQTIERLTKNTGIDIPAAAAIILGGVYYIVLRSKHVGIFNGIDITSPDGWLRIERSIEQLVELALRSSA